MEQKKNENNTQSAQNTAKEQQRLENFTEYLTESGVNPGAIDRVLNGILNTELDAFFTQMGEATATLQAQADKTGEPSRWTDFITDLGNITSIFYTLQGLESNQLRALHKLISKAKETYFRKQQEYDNRQ